MREDTEDAIALQEVGGEGGARATAVMIATAIEVVAGKGVLGGDDRRGKRIHGVQEHSNLRKCAGVNWSD